MFDDTRRATLRTYGEMTGLGISDLRAFEAAVTVFRHRVPDLLRDDAQFIVADWICEELGQ